MNCQDITRLIDSGKFSAMSASDQHDAEAHAHSCRHCAPLWFAHARLATPAPAMPPELSVRCLTLAASGTQTPSSRRASRVMVVVGGLIVLAAAASMLMVNVANAPSPRREDAFPLTPSAQTPAVVSLPGEISIPSPVIEPAVPVADTPLYATLRSLPLFPPPVDADKAFVARQKLALQKLVELYPELVQGPQTEDMFVAAIVLRTDGAVVKHAMQTATRETSRKVNDELRKLMPMDGGEAIGDFARKGTQLADGRALRGNLSYQHLTVPVHYDPARSNLRVDEILRAERAALMLPKSDAGVNYVTVLLTEKGAIQREITEFVGTEELRQRTQLGAAERAKDMARRLGISVDQIGLMGYTPIMDTDGRGMFVDYAWPRRSGETAPAYRQAGPDLDEEGIDVAAVLALVERVMPDAFMSQEVERSLGQAVVVLNEQGQVIRTGRRKPGKDGEQQVQDLLRGAAIGSARTVILTNSRGETAAVFFIWQR